jgi:hypothetical protein
MLDSKVGLPLTFLLALAAAGPASAAVKPGQTAESLDPGSLRNVLGHEKLPASDSTDQARGNRNSAGQLAQGCWYGYWRRC